MVVADAGCEHRGRCKRRLRCRNLLRRPHRRGDVVTLGLPANSLDAPQSHGTSSRNVNHRWRWELVRPVERQGLLPSSARRAERSRAKVTVRPRRRSWPAADAVTADCSRLPGPQLSRADRPVTADVPAATGTGCPNGSATASGTRGDPVRGHVAVRIAPRFVSRSLSAMLRRAAYSTYPPTS